MGGAHPLIPSASDSIGMAVFFASRFRVTSKMRYVRVSRDSSLELRTTCP